MKHETQSVPEGTPPVDSVTADANAIRLIEAVLLLREVSRAYASGDPLRIATASEAAVVWYRSNRERPEIVRALLMSGIKTRDGERE